MFVRQRRVHQRGREAGVIRRQTDGHRIALQTSVSPWPGRDQPVAVELQRRGECLGIVGAERRMAVRVEIRVGGSLQSRNLGRVARLGRELMPDLVRPL